MNLTENNRLTLVGKIISVPEFCHEVYEEKFYLMDVEVARLSENSDVIPVMISEKLMDNLNVGDCVAVEGQIRTYNKYASEKRKLVIYAFVKNITKVSEEEMLANKTPNEITIQGFVCKKPVYRTTPLGREISDLLIAINRPYGKSDYIPSIAWGRNAKFCERLSTGACVNISGRLQSRPYTKKMDDGEEARVAYEVSINRIKLEETTIPQQ